MKTLTTIVLLFSVTLIGCGKNVPLSGKVAFSDGTPLTVGTVVFDDGKSIARGNIQADGSYTLGFGKEGNGLPKGTYRVYVQATEAKVVGKRPPMEWEGEKGEQDVIEQFPLIAAKHCSPETSGLTFTVDGKTKTFDIQVEKPK